MKHLVSQLRRWALPLAVATVSVTMAGAHEYEHGSLHIGHPWARPTAPGMPMAAAYLSITNNGAKDDVLTGARTSAASRVEIHQTSVSDGMARMRPLGQVPIAPGKTIRIEPNGIHLMLVDLVKPLVEGTSVLLTLEFRDAGAVEVTLEIENHDATPAGGAGSPQRAMSAPKSLDRAAAQRVNGGS